jgi:hypothetical protein
MEEDGAGGNEEAARLGTQPESANALPCFLDSRYISWE